MKSRRITFFLCVLLLLALSGCGATDTATNTDTNNSADTTADTDANTTSDAASDTNLSSAENVGNAVSFGESIRAKRGDTFLVADTYSVQILEFDTYYDNTKAVTVRVSSDNGESEHTICQQSDGTFRVMDASFMIPEYVLEGKEVTDDEVEFSFDMRQYPEPMVLSGNYEDVYHMDSYSYVVGDTIDLYFDKDIDVHGDSLILVEQVMRELEEITGMTFQNDSRYHGLRNEGTRECYFGFDPYNGYDYYNRERIAVYFIHDRDSKCWVSCSMMNSVVLIDEDFDFHTESLNTLAHELAHTLYNVNHDMPTQILTEGFGSYFGRRVSILHPEYFSEEHKEYSPDLEAYWYLEPELTAENAEELYSQEFDRMENSSYYEYGFRIMSYLYENYSIEDINAFYEVLSGKIWDYRFEHDEYAKELYKYEFLGDASTPELEVETLKEFFGEDFFTEFGTWVQKNKARFRDF